MKILDIYFNQRLDCNSDKFIINHRCTRKLFREQNETFFLLFYANENMKV